MMRRTGFAGFLVLALVVGAVPSRAASDIVLPRAGQVGLGVQVQGGTLLTSGELGNEFGSGPGLSVRLRYRMRFERAFGLSFDTQHLDARDPSNHATAFDSLTDNTLRERLTLTTAGVEFYQMFDTRSRTTKMISAGAGLVQVSARLSDGETQYPLAGDGVYVSLGAGIERFFLHSMAWDLSTHYMAILHDGKANHDLQLQTGIIFYAAY